MTAEFGDSNEESESESESEGQVSSDGGDGDTPVSAYQALLGSLQAKGGTFTQAFAQRYAYFFNVYNSLKFAVKYHVELSRSPHLSNIVVFAWVFLIRCSVIYYLFKRNAFCEDFFEKRIEKPPYA